MLTMWRIAAVRSSSLPYLASAAGVVGSGGRRRNLLNNASSTLLPPYNTSLFLSSTTSSTRSVSIQTESIATAPDDNQSNLQQDVVSNLFYSFAKTPTHLRGAPPVLRVEDLRSLLLSIGEHLSEERLEKLMGEVDTDHSGTIEFEEFMSGYDKLKQEDPSEKVIDVGQLIRDFRLLDRNGDGVLSLDELEGLLSLSSSSTTDDHVTSLTSEDAYEIMKQADTNKNGTIDITEFIEFMTNPQQNKWSWRLMSGFRVVMLLGGPGSGKGVLCEHMCASATDLIRHCSSGEMLRSEVAAQTPLGVSIESSLSRGELISSATVVALLKKEFAKFPQSILALDGFPRNVENLLDFTSCCGLPESAIFIDVPEDVMIERILHRAKSSGRSDDNIETAKKRVETFKEATLPTLEAIEKNGIEVYKLDGTKHPDEVWKELLKKSSPIRGQFERQMEREREHVLERSF